MLRPSLTTLPESPTCVSVADPVAGCHGVRLGNRARAPRAAARSVGLGTDTATCYRQLARLSELPDDSAVLDIPCAGALRSGLRPTQRLRYVAAALSPVMLSRARREAERRGLHGIEFTEVDVQQLAFDEGRDGHRPCAPTRACGNGTMECMTSPPAIKSVLIVELATGSLRDE